MKHTTVLYTVIRDKRKSSQETATALGYYPKSFRRGKPVPLETNISAEGSLWVGSSPSATPGLLHFPR